MSSSDSPSVRNKIALRHPEVLVPLVFELLKISYALLKAAVKLVPPLGPKLSIYDQAELTSEVDLLASVIGLRSELQVLAAELKSTTVA